MEFQRNLYNKLSFTNFEPTPKTMKSYCLKIFVMKQKISLTVFMLLVTLFAFGQSAELKNNEKFWKSKIERQSIGLKHDNVKVLQGHLFQKIRSFSQNANLKSSQTIKQRLDSLVFEIWDEEIPLHWFPYYKEEYTYDSNGNMTQYLFNNWDDNNNQWEFNEKYECTYDTIGNMTQFRYYWGITNQWIGTSKKEYSYDVNGNIMQYLDYYWDESNSQWVFSSKDEYTYNANANIIQSIEYNWDEAINQWVTYTKDEYVYDANGKLTQSFKKYWDEINNEWFTFNKDDYTYDDNENMTQKLAYYWDVTANQWVESYKDEYIFDAYENVIQYLYSNWDKTASQWVADFKNESTYNNSYSFSDLILPYFYSDLTLPLTFTRGDANMFFNHMLTGLILYVWHETSSDWLTDGRITSYYSEQYINSVSEINGVELNAYPNPFSSYVSFNISGYNDKIMLNLFDIQGRKVLSKEIRNN